MTIRNVIMTLDDGLIVTCHFSTLYMLFRASMRMLTLTIMTLPAEHGIKKFVKAA